MALHIRPLIASNHARWLELWTCYNAFYERQADALQAAHTWQRLLAPEAPAYGVVGCDDAGRQMMAWLVSAMQQQGWSRLYWNTRENNYRASALYDQYTPHSGFLRYVIGKPAAR